MYSLKTVFLFAEFARKTEGDISEVWSMFRERMDYDGSSYSVQRVIDLCCKEFEVSTELFLSNMRGTTIQKARAAACLISSKWLKLKTNVIIGGTGFTASRVNRLKLKGNMLYDSNFLFRENVDKIVAVIKTDYSEYFKNDE